MNGSQIITVSDVPVVLSKHDYKQSAVAEKGGEGAEAGIIHVERTPEGDGNA
jgi:hypothetical protein